MYIEVEEENSDHVQMIEEIKPLDMVLGLRQNGKKVTDNQVNSSENKVPKRKPISKQKNSINLVNNLPNQMNSVQIAKKLIQNENLSHTQTQELLKRASEIKSLKYDKFTQKIRVNLTDVNFQESVVKFKRIFQRQNCNPFLLKSIFSAFEQFWKQLKLNGLNDYKQLLKCYDCLPTVLNKSFLSFLTDLIKKQSDQTMFKSIRKLVYKVVQSRLNVNLQNRQSQDQNQKIVGLVFTFKLEKYVNMDELRKLVTNKKFNEYIEERMKEHISNKEGQLESSKHEKRPQTVRITAQVNNIIDSQIRRSIQLNDEKQTLRLLRTYKIPVENYPSFIDKLQYKFLYHIERQPIYVIDYIIANKVNLIEKMIEIYVRKRRFELVDHLRGKFHGLVGGKDNGQRVLVNPLEKKDSFGPTESHVLGYGQSYLHLNELGVQRGDIYMINSSTINSKVQKSALIQLLESEQIGLDSETRSAIHVLDRSVLQIIQIYCPRLKKVFLFDVQDFKKNKKQRHRKSRQENNKIEMQNQVEESENNNERNENEKGWNKMCRFIHIIFKRCTIYGHVLHGDIKEIIECLGLSLTSQKLRVKDSQVQFKKAFPQQTKSKLSFLSEFCLKKQISKFEQCSAWDYRPLRQSQVHYAAMDAVIPYRIVKWLQSEQNNKSISIK